MEILKIYTIKFWNGKTQTFYANYQEEVERLVEEIQATNNEILDWEEKTFLKCIQCKMFIPQNEIRITSFRDSVYAYIYYCEKCYMNKVDCFTTLNELKNRHREGENNE